jgi:hypothetical protein
LRIWVAFALISITDNNAGSLPTGTGSDGNTGLYSRRPSFLGSQNPVMHQIVLPLSQASTVDLDTNESRSPQTPWPPPSLEVWTAQIDAEKGIYRLPN